MSQKQLYAKIQSPDTLSGPDELRMFELMQRYYGNQEWDDFVRDLSKKTDVIVMRDTQDHTIQGFSTILLFSEKVDGRNIQALFSGDTIVDKRYWGQRVLGKAFSRYILKVRLQNPFALFYWFLVSKGYKTYLLMANNIQNHYPNSNKPTPAFEKKLMDQVYSKLYPQTYKCETGLIQFPYDSCHLRKGVADIDSDLIASNRRVAHFIDKNPNWQKGVELACVAKMDFQSLLGYPVKSAIKIGMKKLTFKKPSLAPVSEEHVAVRFK